METKELTAFNQEYYDKSYFETGDKRIVDQVTGKEKVWGYHGTDWSGHYFILTGILKTLNYEFGSLLDIGAGQGSCVDYALRLGLKSKGYDFSKFAVEHPHNYAKGNLFWGDATNITEPDLSWDIIFCSDMVEHIPQSMIQKVLSEFKRVSKKWIFLQFPVAEEEREVFNAEIHDKSHTLYAHYMIAGHLDMQLRSWWDEQFKQAGFIIRDDLVRIFKDAKVTDPAVLKNWKNVVILEKP